MPKIEKENWEGRFDCLPEIQDLLHHRTFTIKLFICSLLKSQRQETIKEVWDMIFASFPKDMENLSTMTHDQAHRLLKKFIKRLKEKKNKKVGE